MKWSLAAAAVLVIPLLGCGGEDEAADGEDVEFVVMEDAEEAAQAAADAADPGETADPPDADDPAEEPDPVEEPDPADDADDADDDPGDAPGGNGSVEGAQSLDDWEAECIADGESPEECACIIDLLRDETDAAVLDADQLDELMDQVFMERFDDAMACFGEATADDL